MNMRRAIRLYLDSALGSAGLARRRSIGEVIAPALGLVAAGAAFGAGMGLAFAPLSGRRLREDVGGKFDRLRERLKKEPHIVRGANASP